MPHTTAAPLRREKCHAPIPDHWSDQRTFKHCARSAPTRDPAPAEDLVTALGGPQQAARLARADAELIIDRKSA